MGCFCSNLRHRDTVPTLAQFFTMLFSEESVLGRSKSSAHFAFRAPETVPRHRRRCLACRKIGHEVDDCWKLYPEKAPLCENCNQRGHIDRHCARRREENFNVFTDFPITL
jgi:hypothetical protein